MEKHGDEEAAVGVLEALYQWASLTPTKVYATWLEDVNGKESHQITYQDLVRQVESLAVHLLGIPTHADGRQRPPVLLVYPPSLDFIIAFLACLRAGIIPVPIFPPDPHSAKKDLSIFIAVQASCDARIALTSSSYYTAKRIGDLKTFFVGSPTSWPGQLQWICTNTLSSPKEEESIGVGLSDRLPSLASFHEDDLAFLQYTSGSTSEPKGVMITHGASRHNLYQIIKALQASENTVVVSWLPQYHDMGLIGSYLGVLQCGGSGYYMSPVTFIKRPVVWIEAMSRYKATHLQAPNFAYGLVARKFHADYGHAEGRQKIDLSSIQHMINGAEPVDARTMESFYAVFAKFGLKRGVFYPTYGLAENTVFVCSNGRQRIRVDRGVLESKKIVQIMQRDEGQQQEDANDDQRRNGQSIELAGCGAADSKGEGGIEVVIVNPETSLPLAERRVGEVWVRGKSRAAGYYGKPALSQETFGGVLRTSAANNHDSKPVASYHYKGQEYVDRSGYLRTGDQGFVHEGEIFITGRLKDLIIVYGRNIYPQDIEKSVESALGENLRGGCSALFAVEEQNEVNSLVYTAEVKDEIIGLGLAHIPQEIRSLVARDHSVHLSAIYLLKPRTIPKTTSGKIARAWCRKALVEGQLSIVTEWIAVAEGDALEPCLRNGVLKKREASSPSSSIPKTEADVTIEKDDKTQIMESEDLLVLLKKEVAKIIKTAASEVRVDVPLNALGLDSMQGMQLHSIIERQFGYAIPEALMFDPETTLETIVVVLRRGGKLPTPITLIDTAKLAGLEARHRKRTRRQTPASNEAREELVKQCASKASALQAQFPRHHLQKQNAISSFEKHLVRLLLLLFLKSAFDALLFAILALVLLPIKFLALIVVISVACVFTIASNDGDPGKSSLFGSTLKALFLKYFSFKVLYEQNLLEAQGPLLVAFAHPLGHGDLPIAEALLASVFPSLAGRPLVYVQDKPRPWAPLAFFQRRLMTYLGFANLEQMNRLLLHGQTCVGVPTGKTELMGTDQQYIICLNNITIILTSAMTSGHEGTAILPCLTFGAPQKTRRQGSDHANLSPRQPITAILGSPMKVPQVEKAQQIDAQVLEEHKKALVADLQRMFDQHREALGLDEGMSLLLV